MVAVWAALLALAVTSQAGPIYILDDRQSCATTCSDSSKFNYVPGTTYDFDYHVTTETTVEGAAEDRAQLDIRATAELHVLSKCDMALTLRDVTVSRDQGGQLKKELEQRPLRFAFQDGQVFSLCPDPREQAWTLNVKRGLLSALQNSMANLDSDQSVQENDVSGQCTAEYSVTNRGWYSVTVKRSKDLLACTDRHGYRSAVLATPYTASSKLQSLPLLKSTHECVQEVDSSAKILKSASCKERHVFRPFSRHHSGAATTVSQTLTFRSRRAGVSVRQSPVTQRAELFFEHAHSAESEEQARSQALAKLTQLCDVTRSDIRPETPGLFSELVALLRTLDASSLKKVYAQAQQGSICKGNDFRTKKFFLDALPMMQTGPAVQMMRELLTAQEVTGAETTMWLTSLAFVAVPTRDMLVQAKGLLESPVLEERATLPVSTLVHSYCRRVADCERDSAVSEIVSILENNVGQGCYVNKLNIDKVLLNLRALGNVGYVTGSLPILNRCFARSRNPTEVRVSALEAFRRMPCSASREEAMSTFQDASEDHEVRITAYLAMMTCPSDAALAAVRSVLESEEVGQVGSFVWSHLSNLMEASSPHKQAVRAILEDAKLQSDFRAASLKSSRNLEASFFLERLNTGAMVESNVIWSQDSYPRSASLNLTLDLFGSSLNLLEAGGRLEGLNYLLETYLGPYGVFGDAKTKGANSKLLEEVRGSMYMRLFGNELAYGRTQGADSSWNMPNLVEMLLDLSDKHDLHFSQSATLLDSQLTVATAAGLPLHLNVNVTATLDLQVSGKVDLRKVATSPRSMVIDGFVKPSGAVSVSGSMAVAAGGFCSGVRLASTLHSSTALQGRLELQRDRVLKAELDFPQDKMEVFDFKTVFFVVNGEEEREQKMVQDNARSLRLCSGSELSRAAGLQLCGEVFFPNASLKADAPYFPLTGPVGASLILAKTDSHSGYNFFAKMADSKSSLAAQASFSTPGGKEDRTLAFDLVVKKPQLKIDFSIVSPWKKVSMIGAILDSSSVRGVRGSVTVDGQDEYSVTAQLEQDKKGDSITYTSLVEVRRPQAQPLALTGSLVTKDAATGDLSLSLSGFTQEPVVLKSSVESSPKEKAAMGLLRLDSEREYAVEWRLQHDKDMSLDSPFRLNPSFSVRGPRGKEATFKGSADFRPERGLKADVSLDVPSLLNKPFRMNTNLKKSSRGQRTKFTGDLAVGSASLNAKANGYLDFKKAGDVNSRLVLDYNLRRVASDKIVFNNKFNDRSTKSLTKYTLNTNLDSKSFPEFNVMMKSDMTHSRRHTQADLDLRYGANFKDPNKQVALSGEVNHKKAPQGAKLNYKASAVYLPLGVDVEVKGSHEHDRKSLDSGLTLRYAKGQTAQAALTLRDNSNHSTSLSADLTLAYPGRQLALGTDLAQMKSGFVHTVSLNVDKKQENTIKTVYTNPHKGNYKVTSNIDLHEMEPVKVTGGLTLQSNAFKAFASADSNKKTYAASASHKWSPKSGGIWSLDLEHPWRRVAVEGEVGVAGGRYDYDAKLDARWDAGRDDSRRLTLKSGASLKSLQDVDATASLASPCYDLDVDMNVRHQQSDSGAKTSGDVSWGKKDKIAMELGYQDTGKGMTASAALTTPFDDFRKQAAELTYAKDAATHKLSTELAWSRGQKLSASGELKIPFSASSLDLAVRASTPFSGMRNLEGAVRHSLVPHLNTDLSGSVGPHRANVQLAVPRWNLNELEGSVKLDSSVEGWEKVAARLSHRLADRKVSSDGSVDVNDSKYAFLLDGSTALQDDLRRGQSAGTLTLSSPDSAFSGSWQHAHSPADVKSSVSADWGRGRQMSLEVTSQHAAFPEQLSLSGSLKTPWSQARALELTFSHKASSDALQASGQLLQNRDSLASMDIQLRRAYGSVDADVTLSAPALVSVPVVGKANARYARFPVTGHAELQWAPAASFSADGEVNAALPALDASLRLSSPLLSARSLVLKASNRKEGAQWLSSASAESGDGRVVRAASALTASYPLSARVSLVTPLEQLKSLEMGVVASGSLSDLSVKTDLTLLPAPGRFASELALALSSDAVSGRLRLDTPLRSLPYVQATVFAQPGTARASLEYSPRQLLSVETTYMLSQPLALSAVVTTPFYGYERLSAALTHKQPSTWEGQSHAEISYSSYDKLEADAKWNWLRDLEASLLIKTPFQPYQSSALVLRHSGRAVDFTSHGELTLAGQNYAADGSLKLGYSSTGSLVFTSPVPGFENVKAAFTTRGRLSSFRSQASVEVNGQKAEGTLKHRQSDTELHSDVSLSTPFTQDLSAGLDLDGQFPNLQTKLSGAYGSDYTLNSQSALSVRDAAVAASSQLTYRLGDLGSKDLSVTLSHVSTGDDLTTQLTGRADDQEISLHGDYKSGPVRTGNLRLATPFSGLRGVRASFSQEGRPEDFRVSASLDCVENGLSEISLSSRLDSGLVHAELSFKSPYTEDVQVSLDHNGSWRSFSTQARASAGTQRSLSSDSTFRADNGVVLTSSLQYRLPSVSHSLSLNLDHRGPLNDMKTSLEARCEDQAVVLKSSLKAGQNVRASLSLQTPLEGLERVEASVNKRGDLSDFRASAEVDCGSDRKVDGSVQFSLQDQGLKGELKVKSPLFDNMGVSVNHAGQWRAFTSDMSAFWGRDHRLDTAAAFTLNDAVTASGSLGYRLPTSAHQTSFSYGLQGSLSNFTTSLSGKLDDQSADVTAFFQCAVGMQGGVTVMAPLDGLRDSGLTFSHSGNMWDFSSQAETYTESQRVQGKTSFSHSDSQTVGSMDVSSPSGSLPALKVTFNRQGDLSNLKANGDVSYDNENVLSASVSRTETASDVSYSLSLSNVYTEPLALSLQGSKDAVSMGASLGNDYSVQASGKAKSSDKDVEVSGDVHYVLGGEADSLSVLARKEGSLLDLSLTGVAKLGAQEARAQATLRTLGDLAYDVTVTTPWDTARRLGASLSHARRSHSLDSRVKIWLNDQEAVAAAKLSLAGPYTGDLSLSTPMSGLKQAGLVFQLTPETQGFSGQATATLNGQESRAAASFSSAGPIRGETTLTTPLESVRNVGVTFSHQGGAASFVSTSKVTFNQHEAVGLASFESSPLQGKVEATLPFSSLSGLGASFTQSGSLSNFRTQAKANVNDQEGSASATFDSSRGLKGDVTVTLPFSDFRNVAASFQHSGDLSALRSQLKASLNGQEGALVATFGLRPLKGGVVVTTPFSGYRKLGASFQHSGSISGFRSKAKVSVDSQEVALDASLQRDQDLQGQLTLTTPLSAVRSLGLMVRHQGPATHFTTDVSATLNEQAMRAHASLNADDKLEGEVTLTTPFSALQAFQASFDHQGSSQDFRSEAKIKVNEDEASAKAVFKNDDALYGSLTVLTPFQDYRRLGALLLHSTSGDKFDSEAQVTYQDGQQISAKGNGFRHTWSEFGGEIEVHTPFQGAEKTSARLEHRHSDKGLACSGSVTYGSDQSVGGQLRLTWIPDLEGSLALQTPFAGYESVAASAGLEQGFQRYGAKATLTRGRQTLVSLESRLDSSSSPATASLTLLTPLAGWERNELSVSHQGSMTDFRSSASFRSPHTDAVAAEAAVRFQSVYDMEVRAALTSRLPGLEDLRMSVNNAYSGPQYRSHVEVGWTPSDQIVVDSNSRVEKTWYATKVAADLALSTPFDLLRSAAVKLEQIRGQKSFSQQTSLDYNGHKLADGQLEVTSDPFLATLTVNQPHAMVLSARDISRGAPGKTVGEIVINWNRDDPRSNVRLTADYTDTSSLPALSQRDLTLSLVHPLRSMSIYGALAYSQDFLDSRGTLSWDDNRSQRLGYVLELKEGRQASLKLMAPARSMLWRGSLSGGSSSPVVDAAYLWDADSDADKQVAVRAQVHPGDGNKAGVTIKMPSVNKDFQIGSEMTVNQGRTLFDSKTEFSYSPDSRKTLVLTSRLEDISQGYGSSNYSLSLGMTHAHTDLNVQFRSHAGMNSARASAGLQLSYLTSARQTKTVALRAEIDKLRKEIDILMDSPLKKMAVTGKLDTNKPYSLRLKNVYDDREVMTSSLEVNPDTGRFQFASIYDSNAEVRMAGGYDNSTLVSLQLDSDQTRGTDVNMALQLTAPRVLVTSLTWSPSLVSDAKTFASRKLSAQGAEVTQAMDEVSMAVREELAARYNSLKAALREELSPMVTYLDTELTGIDRLFDATRREMSRIHKDNDFRFLDVIPDAEAWYQNIYQTARDVSSAYGKTHVDIVKGLRQALDSLDSVDVRQLYNVNVHAYVMQAKVQLNQLVPELSDLVAKTDEHLQNLQDSYERLRAAVEENITGLKEHPTVVRMRNLVPDVDSVVEEAGRHFRVLPRPALPALLLQSLLNHSVANEVYQQGVWAWRYWDVEKNVEEHAKSLLRLLQSLVLDELEAYRPNLDCLTQTKVTTFDPKQGQMRAQLTLPVELKDLQQAPDVTSYVEGARRLAAYLPDPQELSRQAWQHLPDVESVVRGLQSLMPAPVPPPTPRRWRFLPQWTTVPLPPTATLPTDSGEQPAPSLDLPSVESVMTHARSDTALLV